jgi:hypothetical protein
VPEYLWTVTQPSGKLVILLGRGGVVLFCVKSKSTVRSCGGVWILR